MTLDDGQRKVLHQLCSLLLRYPDAELRAVLPAVDEALLGLPTEFCEFLSTLSTHVASGDPVELAATYSETFDFACSPRIAPPSMCCTTPSSRPSRPTAWPWTPYAGPCRPLRP